MAQGVALSLHLICGPFPTSHVYNTASMCVFTSTYTLVLILVREYREVLLRKYRESLRKYLARYTEGTTRKNREVLVRKYREGADPC